MTAPSPHAAALARVKAGESFSTDEVLELQKAPGFLDALGEEFDRLPPPGREAALRLAAETGRPLIPPREPYGARLAEYVGEPRAVALLVRGLADAERAVRNEAGRLLADLVPDRHLRSHARAVEDALRRHPTTDEAVLLLGMLGSESARQLVESTEEIREASREATEAALARLGDAQAEDAVVAAWRGARDPAEKARQARRLGYVATVRTILLLAQELRTRETYVWTGSARRSMRVHVIEGLQRACPTEVLLWRPPWKPENDSYYDAIEDWATRRIGVTWSSPRPAFLYEEDSPIMPF